MRRKKMPFSVAVNLMAFGDLFTLMPFNGRGERVLSATQISRHKFAAKRIIIVRMADILTVRSHIAEECCAVRVERRRAVI